MLPFIVAAVVGPEAAPPPSIAPASFHTAAHFSVDATELALTTAVATFEPHRTFQGYSWLHVYFYAFPLTDDDVSGVMSGNVDGLDRKQLQRATTAREHNSSRAVLHLLIEKDATVSNVSLEVPGVTCTIAETPEKVKRAFPEYQFDGKRVALHGTGTFECDLRSIGMGKRLLGWNVDVKVPAFEKH
jgi:hypothetical protein